MTEEQIWLEYGLTPESHRLRVGITDNRGGPPSNVREISVEEARRWAEARGEQAMANLDVLLSMSGLSSRTR